MQTREIPFTPIGFFTPVRFDPRYNNWTCKVIQFVDAYFHLWGRVASYRYKHHNNYFVELEETSINPLHTLLKIVSLTAPLLQRLAAYSFPRMQTYPGVRQLQIALSSVPFILLAAKIVLRTKFQFGIMRANPNATEWVFGIDYQNILKTLNVLLGWRGPVSGQSHEDFFIGS